MSDSAAGAERPIILVDDDRRSEVLDALLRASITAEFAAGWGERRGDGRSVPTPVRSVPTVPLPVVRLRSLRDFLGLGS